MQSLQPVPPPHARSASQVSLVPASSDASKRTLLLIYIHGFMGNEASFQAFPAHLHNLLCVTLAPFDYLVHTKVYPKFKTRHYLIAAVAAFSQWLSSFECDTTDVVLLGHSMGGLLAAEVALIRDNVGRTRHRLLGIVSFDTPFLGMDPGIIPSGIGSLFRSSPESPPTPPATDNFFSRTPQRNFSVAVRRPEGPWESTLHFIDKHYAHLTQATTQYLISHLEFGACLADRPGLKERYAAVRREDLGFINYYTASTGRTKEPRTCEGESEAVREARRREKEAQVHGVQEHQTLDHSREKQENDVKALVEKGVSGERRPATGTENAEEGNQKKGIERTEQTAPAQGIERRQPRHSDAEPEKEPEQDHEKRELARLAREQARMDAESRRMNGISEPRPPSPASREHKQPALDGVAALEQEQHGPCPESLQPPKKRERFFCLLPHDAENNSWVKVPMDGVDEVGAHCGLFVLGPVYERLVGDVAGRVEAWVGEEVSWRVAEEPEMI